MIRRMSFRNDRHLFRRKDDATGREIFSSFPQAAPLKVYDTDYWWSDAWDPLDYGRDYDFSRPFFEQFRELLYSVPVFSRSILGLVNSDYCDQAGWLKNCYLVFDAGNIEDSAYINRANFIKDSFDLYAVGNSELCYESASVGGGYRVFFSFDCGDSTDIWFSKDLSGCNNCFGCVNLRNKSYHIFNEPYGKEEYFEKLKEFNLGSSEALGELAKKAYNFWLQFPVKFMHGYQNVNSDGEQIFESRNVHKSYAVGNGENIKYSQIVFLNSTECYDFTNFGYNSSHIYESSTCGIESYRLKFCWECWKNAEDLEYCAFSNSSSNLFGCVGLRKKQYCILNKQYTKESFDKLKAKIIEQMSEVPYTDRQKRVYKYGEFFPPEFSPFGYNELMLQDYFPLTEEKARAQGYGWRETEKREYQITKSSRELPDRIQDADDSVLKEILGCASCEGVYRIIPMELKFLQKIGIPLPRLCLECRFQRRFSLINRPKFWKRKCQCAGESDDQKIYKNVASHPPHPKNQHCPNEFETSYAPDRPEIVYCEQCYQAEVV